MHQQKRLQQKRLQQKKLQQKKLQQKRIPQKRRISCLKLLLIGKFGKTHGVSGQIKVHSFTEQEKDILNHSHFYNKDGTEINLKIITDGSGKIFGKISGIDSIEPAKEFTNKEIFIDKESLPELGEKEYYWDDLIGATVNNLEGYNLGIITKIENHGASDLIFIDNKEGQEIIVPIENEFFQKFEKDNNLIIVDWEIDED